MQLGCGILYVWSSSVAVYLVQISYQLFRVLTNIKNLRTSLVHTAVRMSAKNAGGTISFWNVLFILPELVLVIWAILTKRNSQQLKQEVFFGTTNGPKYPILSSNEALIHAFFF